jgi:hypothetical protein
LNSGFPNSKSTWKTLKINQTPYYNIQNDPKVDFLTIFKSENVTGTHFLRGGCKSRALHLQPIKIKRKVNMKISKYMIIALTENKA